MDAVGVVVRMPRGGKEKGPKSLERKGRVEAVGLVGGEGDMQ